MPHLRIGNGQIGGLSGEFKALLRIFSEFVHGMVVNHFFVLFSYDLAMNDFRHRDIIKQLHDYRLTTAEIIYHLPDHPSLLQSYIWQDLDVAPRFPILKKFLHFWETQLEGKLYRIKIAHAALITPGEFRYCGHEFVTEP